MKIKKISCLILVIAMSFIFGCGTAKDLKQNETAAREEDVTKTIAADSLKSDITYIEIHSNGSCKFIIGDVVYFHEDFDPETGDLNGDERVKFGKKIEVGKNSLEYVYYVEENPQWNFRIYGDVRDIYKNLDCEGVYSKVEIQEKDNSKSEGLVTVWWNDFNSIHVEYGAQEITENELNDKELFAEYITNNYANTFCYPSVAAKMDAGQEYFYILSENLIIAYNNVVYTGEDFDRDTGALPDTDFAVLDYIMQTGTTAPCYIYKIPMWKDAEFQILIGQNNWNNYEIGIENTSMPQIIKADMDYYTKRALMNCSIKNGELVITYDELNDELFPKGGSNQNERYAVFFQRNTGIDYYASVADKMEQTEYKGAEIDGPMTMSAESFLETYDNYIEIKQYNNGNFAISKDNSFVMNDAENHPGDPSILYKQAAYGGEMSEGDDTVYSFYLALDEDYTCQVITYCPTLYSHINGEEKLLEDEIKCEDYDDSYFENLDYKFLNITVKNGEMIIEEDVEKSITADSGAKSMCFCQAPCFDLTPVGKE